MVLSIATLRLPCRSDAVLSTRGLSICASWHDDGLMGQVTGVAFNVQNHFARGAAGMNRMEWNDLTTSETRLGGLVAVGRVQRVSVGMFW